MSPRRTLVRASRRATPEARRLLPESQPDTRAASAARTSHTGNPPVCPPAFRRGDIVSRGANANLDRRPAKLAREGEPRAPRVGLRRDRSRASSRFSGSRGSRPLPARCCRRHSKNVHGIGRHAQLHHRVADELGFRRKADPHFAEPYLGRVGTSGTQQIRGASPRGRVDGFEPPVDARPGEHDDRIRSLERISTTR